MAATAADVQEWFVSGLADLLGIEPGTIDVTAAFDRYGLDSSAAIGLVESLGNRLGCELEPTLLYEYPTVRALTQHLVAEGKVRP